MTPGPAIIRTVCKYSSPLTVLRVVYAIFRLSSGKTMASSSEDFASEDPINI